MITRDDSRKIAVARLNSAVTVDKIALRAIIFTRATELSFWASTFPFFVSHGFLGRYLSVNQRVPFVHFLSAIAARGPYRGNGQDDA